MSIRRYRIAVVLLLAIVHASIGYRDATPDDRPAAVTGSYDSLSADRGAAAVPNIVTFRFIDEETGLPTPVRVGIFTQLGVPVPPSPPDRYLYQDLGNQSYFYCGGSINLGMRSGLYTVCVSKGFEYRPVAFQTFISRSDQITIVLKRMLSMAAEGWYAGDTHTHMLHEPVNYRLLPADLLLAIEAEDLHFANVMEEFEQFTGRPYYIEPDRILFFSREYRNPHFGHLSLLGITEWLFTEGGCWGISGVACGKTLNSVIASRVHEQPGAIVIATHPFPSTFYGDLSEWPGGGIARGMPIDLVEGSIDAIDILCYSHLPPPEGVDEYFHALNAGFQIPASAGSDAGLSKAHSFPPGGYRLYAYIDRSSGSLDADSWIRAVKRGRSFITNYPLFETFQLADSGIGAAIETDEPFLSGSVRVRCAAPLERVDIIGDGMIIGALFPEPGSDSTRISGAFSIATDSIRWIVARAIGSHRAWNIVGAPGLFAQTNPIYIERSNLPSGFLHPAKQAAADHFLFRLSQLRAFFDQAGYFPANSRAAFDSALAVSNHYFNALVPDPPSASVLVWPAAHPDSAMHSTLPTLTPTFRWKRSFDPDPLDTIAYRLLYGTDSTFETGSTMIVSSDTFYTVPEEHTLVNQTRYFWKVVACDNSGLETESIPALSAFLTDIHATGEGGRPPAGAWELAPAWPNPFNPDVIVAYTVPADGNRHRLDVVDVRGTLVRSLYSGSRSRGSYEARWDGRDESGTPVASGVYFIRLHSPEAGISMARKLVLLK